ncbi:MAG: SDR family NAD(P)-dependent oxidoreductase [Candidatus Manganitrophus sp.]|nr:SDR family NAD(P)-dependent oxidoreductase [Candidatus Manganitrophus sp.]
MIISLYVLSEPAWDQVIRTNLTGIFYSMREAGRIMYEQGGGHIINIASLSAFTGTNWPSGVYSLKTGSDRTHHLRCAGMGSQRDTGQCRITRLPRYGNDRIIDPEQKRKS